MLSLYEVGGKHVVRNALLNFSGSLLPLVVGVVTIPFVIRRLGVDRFGVLSLAWIVLTYFSMFDFGLGRATTKFVSEALGRGEIEKVPSLVWTSLIFQILLGVLGGILLVSLTPVGVDRILRIPADLRVESRQAFYIFGAAIPIGICSLSFRGVLEAGQRFDIVNVNKISINSLIFLMPALGVILGFRLPGIALLLLITQLAGGLVFFFSCLHIFPVLRKIRSIQISTLGPLFSYGGWVTGYNLIIPLTTYLDRFFIGIVLSVGMVPYYTVPYDTISRMQILPQSLSSSLFPAFSSMGTVQKAEIGNLCARAIKYLLTVMGPLALALVLFAQLILKLWLGGAFPEKSTLVLQILVIGAFLNALSWPPATVLLATGRPDLVTKIYVFLLVTHAGLAWFLIAKIGLLGAALAVVFRGTVQLIASLFAARRSMALPVSVIGRNGLFRTGVAAAVLVVALSLAILAPGHSSLIDLGVMTVLTSVFLFSVFRYVLDEGDRADLRSGLFHFFQRIRFSQ